MDNWFNIKTFKLQIIVTAVLLVHMKYHCGAVHMLLNVKIDYSWTDILDKFIFVALVGELL